MLSPRHRHLSNQRPKGKGRTQMTQVRTSRGQRVGGDLRALGRDYSHARLAKYLSPFLSLPSHSGRTLNQKREGKQKGKLRASSFAWRTKGAWARREGAKGGTLCWSGLCVHVCMCAHTCTQVCVMPVSRNPCPSHYNVKKCNSMTLSVNLSYCSINFKIFIR